MDSTNESKAMESYPQCTANCGYSLSAKQDIIQNVGKFMVM